MIMKDGLIIGSNGTKAWYLNGVFHRVDGPAIEYAYGTKIWYQNNLLHREDGPAIVYASGDKSWWINGEQIYCKTNEEFLRIVKMKAFL